MVLLLACAIYIVKQFYLLQINDDDDNLYVCIFWFQSWGDDGADKYDDKLKRDKKVLQQCTMLLLNFVRTGSNSFCILV